MKLNAFILAAGLVIAFSIGTRVSSDEPGANASLKAEVKQLLEQVGSLRQDVEYLMIDHRADQMSVEVLTRRVDIASRVHDRIRALYEAEAQGGGAEQLHRCNAELRLAKARLAFAKLDYQAAMNHFDAAVAASKLVNAILDNKIDTGTVGLEHLIAVQHFVADTQLERNRAGRRIEVLTRREL